MAEYNPPPSAVFPYGYYQPPPPAPQLSVGVVPPQAPQTQPPIFASYVAPFPAYGSYDEVRTLFVAGLPEDVKPREIYNLFREFPGYESSHLRSPTQSSLGMVFDLEKGSTLYIDLAKSNSRSKRSRPDDEWTGLDKKARGYSAFSRETTDSGFGSVHMPGMGNSAYNMIGYPNTQSHANFDGRGPGEIKDAKLNDSSAPRDPKSAPSCATLFYGKFGPNLHRARVNSSLFKMQSSYGHPVAFVDFQDKASSTAALNNLRGTILCSSLPSDGLWLEYAKSRMGMPRKPK